VNTAAAAQAVVYDREEAAETAGMAYGANGVMRRISATCMLSEMILAKALLLPKIYNISKSL